MTPRETIEKRLTDAGYDKRNPADYEILVTAFAEILETDGRGALITGSVGCGKTMAMKAITGHTFCIECFDRVRLQLLTMEDQEHNVHDYIRGSQDLFIDDIGAEDVVSNYGNRVNIVADFIINWHADRVKIEPARRPRLFLTTNLTTDKLLEKYGLRLIDRIAELCDFVQMSGKSNRRVWKKYGTTKESEAR